MSNWQFAENEHCGVDYASMGIVEKYDSEHGKFRNYKQEASAIVDILKLSNESVIMDIGCGTAGITAELSKVVKKIFAIDPSAAMIQYAKQKHGNIDNIEFIVSGFLGLESFTGKVDAVISTAALHHLPDFWKMIALKNISDVLNRDGLFYLLDVVFCFDHNSYKEKIDPWITAFAEKVNESFIKEIETHIRDEHSTYDWILEEMIKRNRFEIVNKHTNDGMIVTYLCRKCV
jgi:putative AdoMet-dependent methyltransferase